MSNILGNKTTIAAAQKAKAGDKTVLVNWDAIRELPDQYEVMISEVKFDPGNLKESFSDVGNGNFMPSPAMHYQIAEAKGISGGENSILDPIYEEVNIGEMEMRTPAKFQKMLVGYRCMKFSTVMEEDGTLRRSGACTIDYNVWNRCAELWAKEEELSEGYTKVLNGEYTYFGKKYTGKHIMVKKGKYTNASPLKYDTKWKRKSSFQTELKFAMQKAETKAHEKTIRELAGLQTGYQADDLKQGRLIFAKVRRSKEILQAEAAARLSAMSQGVEALPAPNQALFGNGTIEVVEEPEPEIEFEIVKTDQELITDALEMYKKGSSIPDDMVGAADNILKWLGSKKDAKADEVYWPKAIGILQKIEKDIPEEFRLDHKLYK